MYRSEGSQSVNQNLPFSIRAEGVEPEVGFLNGVKVEVVPSDIRGIQVSQGAYEEIPRNSRTVKISFKDFRKWLRNCRPVKALEHLLMGKAKRKLLKQNWVPITEDKAKEALKAAGDTEQQEVLASKIKEFNTTLSKLAQKKIDYASMRLENDEFKAKYKTILAIMDGKLNSSRKLPQNLVVALPPSEDNGHPQYILLESPSHRVRKEAANQLAKIFRNSVAYDNFTHSKDRVNRIKSEREELKKSLNEQAVELKKLHKNLIDTKVENDRDFRSKVLEDQKNTNIEEVNSTKEEELRRIEDEIKANSDVRNQLNARAEEISEKIRDEKVKQEEDEVELAGLERDLANARNLSENLASARSSIILNEDGVVEIEERRNELSAQVNMRAENISELNKDFEFVQGQRESEEERADQLDVRKREIILTSEKEIKEIEKKYVEDLAKINKELVEDVVSSVGVVANMVSGSPKKMKPVKSSGSAMPDDES